MAKITPATATIVEDYMVCEDCTSWLANADTSSLDYYYSEEEAMDRLNEIQDGERLALSRFDNGFFAMGSIKNSLDFSKKSCDCCRATESGSRVEFHLMAA